MKVNILLLVLVCASPLALANTSAAANLPEQERADRAYVLDNLKVDQELTFTGQIAPADFELVVASLQENVPEGKSNCRTIPGIASVYGGPGDGPNQKLASGGRLDPGAFTAAMLAVPMGKTVDVVNLRNGRRTKLKINDHGPYVRGRVIDVTPAGARALGFSGLAPVKVYDCH